MENAGFTSVWHWKHSTGCDAFSSLSSVFPSCTLWQLMQPTPALAWGARSKFGCVPAWQPRQVASTCFSGSLASILILVTSPPPSTWALPDPWQLSQVTPWPPCSNARLPLLCVAGRADLRAKEIGGFRRGGLLRHGGLLIPTRGISRSRNSEQQCNQRNTKHKTLHQAPPRRQSANSGGFDNR